MKGSFISYQKTFGQCYGRVNDFEFLQIMTVITDDMIPEK